MSRYEVIDHLLYLDGEPVEFVRSPNHGGEITPRIIVIHATGTQGVASPLSWLANSQSGVSAHLVIDKDGTVYQMVPFNYAAWHAGKSEYDGEPNVNNFSIGIENVGMGGNDPWPDKQIDANRDVIAALLDAYEIEDVVGHSDVAIPPGRKVDPGPNYPWDKVVEDA